jgi:putative tryptophan/tyrosine transport system substrate-binding protein
MPTEGDMRTISRLVLIVAALAFSEEATPAQRVPQVPRIGILVPGVPGQTSLGSPFLRQGLQDLGYVEGRSVAIEYRAAEGQVDRLSELAADLVRLEVSVIVAAGPPSVEAAINATRRIPIVMIDPGDPVSRGFVKSLSLPGGNVTGFYGDAGGWGSDGKRLELLTEAFPGIARVALLNPQRREGSVKNYERAAKALGVSLERVDVHSPTEFEPAFSKIRSMRPDALITMSSYLSTAYATKIAEFALEQRLLAMYESPVFTKEGGLMSYHVDTRAQWHRAAFHVDKILKGANPAVMPVEPPQFKFVINLQTARRLGLAVAPEILLEANEIIR